MWTDERGLALTTSSERAVRAFDDAIACSLEYRLRITTVVRAMLAADPTFVMGHVLVGYLMVDRGTSEGVADAAKALDRLTGRRHRG